MLGEVPTSVTIPPISEPKAMGISMKDRGVPVRRDSCAATGISMASALLSLARNQAPKKGVAMTGELTLTGLVLPIGGLREKVIAARRLKLYELIIPELNRGDFEELPDYLKEGLTMHFAKRFSDVVKVLF